MGQRHHGKGGNTQAVTFIGDISPAGKLARKGNTLPVCISFFKLDENSPQMMTPCPKHTAKGKVRTTAAAAAASRLMMMVALRL